MDKRISEYKNILDSSSKSREERESLSAEKRKQDRQKKLNIARDLKSAKVLYLGPTTVKQWISRVHELLYDGKTEISVVAFYQIVFKAREIGESLIEQTNKIDRFLAIYDPTVEEVVWKVQRLVFDETNNTVQPNISEILNNNTTQEIIDLLDITWQKNGLNRIRYLTPQDYIKRKEIPKDFKIIWLPYLKKPKYPLVAEDNHLIPTAKPETKIFRYFNVVKDVNDPKKNAYGRYLLKTYLQKAKDFMQYFFDKEGDLSLWDNSESNVQQTVINADYWSITKKKFKQIRATPHIDLRYERLTERNVVINGVKTKEVTSRVKFIVLDGENINKEMTVDEAISVISNPVYTEYLKAFSPQYGNFQYLVYTGATKKMLHQDKTLFMSNVIWKPIYIVPQE